MLLLVLLVLLSSLCVGANTKVRISAGKNATVKIWAVDYVTLHPQQAVISVYDAESDKLLSKLEANSFGYAFFNSSVGSLLYFVGSSSLHKTTTSPIVTVPDGGLTTELTQVVLQMPSDLIFELFWAVTPAGPGKHKDKTKCMVVVTVCAENKTVASHPQGLPGTSVKMVPPNYSTIFYFGVWSFSNETNPLPNDLNSTSWDGGVLIEDVPVSNDIVYEISAFKKGYDFTTTKFKCIQPGSFINGAPNQGPRVTGHDYSHKPRSGDEYKIKSRCWVDCSMSSGTPCFSILFLLELMLVCSRH